MHSKLSRILKSVEKGNFNVLSGLIKIGSNHRTLKYIAPELKAGISAKFLALDKLELDQISTEMVIDNGHVQEDQLKLVKLIEKHMKINGQFSTNFLQSRKYNDFVQLIGKKLWVLPVPVAKRIQQKLFQRTLSLWMRTKLAALAEELYKKVEMKGRQEAEAEAAGYIKLLLRFFRNGQVSG